MRDTIPSVASTAAIARGVRRSRAGRRGTRRGAGAGATRRAPDRGSPWGSTRRPRAARRSRPRAGARRARGSAPRDAFLRPRAPSAPPGRQKCVPTTQYRATAGVRPASRSTEMRHPSRTPSLTSRRSPAPSADSAQIRHTPATKHAQAPRSLLLDARFSVPPGGWRVGEGSRRAAHPGGRGGPGHHRRAPRAELQSGGGRRPRPPRPRARAPRPHAAAVTPPRDQRHRRDRPHQPRPRAARRSGARRGHASGPGLLQPRMGCRDRHARLPPRPRRAPPHRADRRRGRARRQQRRRRGPARRRRAGRPRQGDRGLARPARRDRGRLPHPGRGRRRRAPPCERSAPPIAPAVRTTPTH